MRIGKALTYVFDDARWVSKVLIGLAISLVPILNLAFNGYIIEIVRRMSRQESEILPEWENLERRFIDGLLLTLAYLLYSLPLILCCVLYNSANPPPALLGFAGSGAGRHSDRNRDDYFGMRGGCGFSVCYCPLPVVSGAYSPLCPLRELRRLFPDR